MQSTYRPYEELQFSLSGNILTLNTPWTEIEAEIPAELHMRVREVCETLHQENAVAEEVSELLENFKDHYVAYAIPRSLSLNSSHCSQTVRRLDSEASPTDWLAAFVPAVAPKIDLSHKQWNIDIEAVLRESRSGKNANIYDPVSAYRYLLHWALKTVHEKNHAEVDAGLFTCLENLLEKNEAAFLQVARYYIRQYHYVTSNSFDCLVPAMETMPYSKELVQKLSREEYGHGSFTGNSLKQLGVTDPTSVPLGPTVVGLMGFLANAAHLNGLAFSCLFNLFELPGEQEEDPLAQLLFRSSLPAAAQGIAAHFKFNKDGAHFTNGICLVEGMEGVDAYTILEATRMAEMHFFLHENAAKEVTTYANQFI